MTKILIKIEPSDYEVNYQVGVKKLNDNGMKKFLINLDYAKQQKDKQR